MINPFLRFTMNSELNFNLKLSDYASSKDLPPNETEFDQEIKSKLDLLVKRALDLSHLSLDNIQLISIDKQRGTVQISTKSLTENTLVSAESAELIALAQQIFIEKNLPSWNKVDIRICGKNTIKETPKESPILPNIQSKSPSAVTSKHLAMIHADEFISSSELEGSQAILNLRYLFDFLYNSLMTGAYGISQEVLDEIEGGILFSLSLKNPSEITKHISSSLNSKKPLLMTGGWTGIPHGHTIIYELVPGPNEKATLRLYNLGAGILGTIAQGAKEKTPPMVEWQGIPYANLINPRFVDILYELERNVVIPYSSESTSYGSEDIYSSLKETLQPETEKIIFNKEAEAILMTPQRAGTCSWKSLMAFLRTKMPEKSYKIFKCDIKLKSLIDSYDSIFPRDPLSKNARWNLINKSLASTSRSIDKLYENGFVGKEYICEAHRVLMPVHEWLKKNKPMHLRNDAIPEPQFLKHYSFSKSDTMNWKKGAQINPEAPLNNGMAAINASQRRNLLLDEIQDILSQPVDAKHLGDLFTRILPRIEESWLDGYDYDSHSALNLLISKLPIEKEFWIQAANQNPQKANDLLLRLAEMQKLYFKTCWTTQNASLVFPERVLGMYKLLYLEHHLAEIIEPNIWPQIKPQNYELYRQFINHNSPSHSKFYFHFNNPKEENEFIEINDWLIKDSECNLFKHDNVHDEGHLSKMSFSDKELITSKLCQIDPQLIAKIEKDIPEFKYLPNHKKNATIWGSPHLPPWIKAVVESNLYATCLLNDSLYNPRALDRKEDLNLKSYVIDTESSTEIKWNLSGIELSKRNYDKFKQFYPPFKSKKIKNFLHALLSSQSVLAEKWLVTGPNLTYYIKNPEDCEEFKEFAYLNLSPDLCIPSTLSFFESHPECLFDSDYQIIFEMMIFQTGSLQKTLILDGFKNKLTQFIENGQENCLQDNQIQTAVFLARMARYFQRYSSDLKLHEMQLPLLRKLLLFKGLDINQKSLIYAEICANLSTKESLNPEDVDNLLVGSTFIGRHPVPQHWTNEYIAKDITDSLQKHAGQLQKALIEGNAPNQSLLNLILKMCDPKAQEEKWLVKIYQGEYPCFSTETRSHQYYPLLGDLTAPGIHTSLPHRISANKDFQKLFPTIKTGLQLEGNVVSFKDPADIETCVKIKANELIIDQFREGKWYRYVPKDTFVDSKWEKNPFSPIYSRYLVDHCDAWRALNEDPLRLILTDPSTKKCLYICKFEKSDQNHIKISSVQRISDKTELGISSPLMTTVEDPAFIHEWYNAKGLAEVELPRYSLSFKTDPKNASKLYCNNLPGFFLKPGDLLNKLGVYRHYLVLENDHGIKKVILPVHHFSPPKELKPEVLIPRYTIEMDLESQISKPQQYHVFEVKKNGKLFSKSREANLYFAEVSLLAQNYKQAAAILKHYGPKLRAYTPGEIETLQKIASINRATGDIGGNAIGIQTYASYLLEKNLKDFPSNLSKKTETYLAKNYQLYLNHLNTVTVLQLTLDEERYVIRAVPKTSVIDGRLHQLNEAGGNNEKEEKALVSNISYSPFQSTQSELNFKNLTTRCWYPWQFREDMEKFPSHLTRASSSFKSMKITALYALIWELPRGEPLEDFRTQLIFWKHHEKDATERIKAIFLLLVIDNPHKFPPIPIDLNESNFNEWWEKVVAIAQQVAKNSPPKMPFTPQIDLFSTKGRRISRKPSEKISTGALHIDKAPPLRDKKIFGPENTAWFDEVNRPLTSSSSPTQYKVPITSIFERLASTPFEDSKKPGSSNEKEQKPNPLICQETSRLKHDFQKFSQQPPAPHYQIKNGALLEIEKFCKDTIELEDANSHKTQLIALKQDILALARKSPKTDFEIARKDLLTWGGQQKSLTLDELIVNFAIQDPTALKARNPALSIADINDIYTKIGTYLQLYTQKQQAKRALATLNGLKTLQNDSNASPEAIDDLVQKLANDLKASRCYVLEDNPAFLVFEYFADILLRPQQTSMISDFLSGKDPQAIRELIMGSGKSKVLMPLLGLLRADGKKLSTIIVPQALYQSVTGDTQAILRDAFGTSLYTFEFDRKTTFDIETLENILEDLNKCCKSRGALIITSKSVQCLLLKFIDKTVEHFKGPSQAKEMTPELKLMREILGLLSSESLPLLDEADLLLNVLHEVSFSLGGKNGPIGQECELIADLYNILYSDERIKKLARIESDPKSIPSAPILTESLYHSQIKRPLAEIFIERMQTKEFDDKGLQSRVNGYFKDLSPENNILVLEYLCRSKGKEKSTQEFYNQQPEEIREILSMAGEEISNLLPHSLLKPCDEKYGVDLDAGGILAIPFFAAKSPSRGSEFTSHHITMNYTLQYYAKNTIPKNVLEKQLQSLQENARAELRDSLGEKELHDTAAWKIYNEIKGNLNIPLFNLTSQQLNLLFDEINRNVETRLKITKNLILPEVIIFDSTISSNSHNLASFFKVLCGFTGTLWNSASMHRKLSPQPAQGTDALTIQLLWENSYDAVHTIKQGTAEEMMKQLKSKVPEFDLVTDAGGYFKENDNLNNAKLLSQILNKPTVYYDSRGEQTIIEGTTEMTFAESPLKDKAELRATFLDQAHGTGADTTQKPRAVGLVTIGAGMLLRDLFQAVWRLRGLDKSQRVHFILLEDVETIIRQTLKIMDNQQITFADILSFVIINQAKQQGRDNFKAFNAELNEVSQKAFLEVILDPNSSPKHCAEIVEKLGETWIKSSFASANVLYGQLPIEGDSEIIRKQIESKAIDTAIAKGLDSKISDIKEISNRFHNSLPPVVSTKIGNEGLTSEREQQKISEKHSEVESITGGDEEEVLLGEINEINTFKTFTPDRFTTDLYPIEIRKLAKYELNDLPSTPLPIFSLKLFFQEYEEFKPYVNAFEGIDISLGMLQIIDKEDVSLEDFAFFGREQKKINYLMIDENKVTLINNEEASRRIKAGYKNLYELRIGYVNSKDKISENIIQNLIKVKFLNGESRYTLKEMNYLRSWIEKEGVQKMYDLYTKHILKNQILKSRKYQQSPLQKLFHELMK